VTLEPLEGEQCDAPDVPLISHDLFRRRLESHYGKTILLRINDNRSTVLNVRKNPGEPVRFSVHRMFLTGDDSVIKALAGYLRRPGKHTFRTLREFINSRPEHNAGEGAGIRNLNLRARGRVYDLHCIASEVNQQFFSGNLKVYITWGRGIAEPRRRRHILFGSYDHRLNLVRIHPALDSAAVPEMFVRFVVFHEMLHAQLDRPLSVNGRRCVHTAEFRQLEKAHPDYAAAMEWEHQFLNGARARG